MNIAQLVKFDIYSIIKSPLTYLALILTWAPMILVTVLQNQQNDEVDAEMLLEMGSWFFSVVGLLFVIKTLTRDISQGTLQLFMNKTSHRIGYVIAKTISIIFIAVLMIGILAATILIIEGVTDGSNVKGDKFLDLLWFYIIFQLFYGLLLYLFALVVPKTALIFTLGIFLILFVPFAEPFLPMIPKIGEHIEDSLKYIPFSYLTDKTTDGDYTFTNWQWFISVASIVVLFIVNLFYVSKKDI